jgi:hypothetical protein
MFSIDIFLKTVGCEERGVILNVNVQVVSCILRSHDRASWQILIIKPTRCTNFSIYFGMKLYMFRTVPLSIIRSYSLYTQQWYMSYRFVDSLRAGSGWNTVPFWSCCCCSKAVYKPVWHISLLSVQWITPDDGQRNSPKHVEFHSKIKLRN